MGFSGFFFFSFSTTDGVNTTIYWRLIGVDASAFVCAWFAFPFNIHGLAGTKYWLGSPGSKVL